MHTHAFCKIRLCSCNAKHGGQSLNFKSSWSLSCLNLDSGQFQRWWVSATQHKKKEERTKPLWWSGMALTDWVHIEKKRIEWTPQRPCNKRVHAKRKTLATLGQAKQTRKVGQFGAKIYKCADVFNETMREKVIEALGSWKDDSIHACGWKIYLQFGDLLWSRSSFI